MNNNRRPTEHLILGLVVSVICLELLASILPHVLVPLVILATVVVHCATGLFSHAAVVEQGCK